jgi:hypothetical protein
MLTASELTIINGADDLLPSAYLWGVTAVLVGLTLYMASPRYRRRKLKPWLGPNAPVGRIQIRQVLCGCSAIGVSAGFALRNNVIILIFVVPSLSLLGLASLQLRRFSRSEDAGSKSPKES